MNEAMVADDHLPRSIIAALTGRVGIRSAIWPRSLVISLLMVCTGKVK